MKHYVLTLDTNLLSEKLSKIDPAAKIIYHREENNHAFMIISDKLTMEDMQREGVSVNEVGTYNEYWKEKEMVYQNTHAYTLKGEIDD